MTTQEHIALGDLITQLEIHGWSLNKIKDDNFWNAFEEALFAWEEAEQQPLKIWVAAIEGPSSTGFRADWTEEALVEQIYGYVTAWWEREIGDSDIPEDRREAIDQYFETMNNMGSNAEFVTWEEVEVGKTD